MNLLPHDRSLVTVAAHSAATSFVRSCASHIDTQRLALAAGQVLFGQISYGTITASTRSTQEFRRRTRRRVPKFNMLAASRKQAFFVAEPRARTARSNLSARTETVQGALALSSKVEAEQAVRAVSGA